MGRCAECRKQTQTFCFVHQEFICPASLASAEAHALCVVGSYRKWVQDSSYEWPPKCALCATELTIETEVARLTCLHALHAKCLAYSPPQNLSCPVCAAAIVPGPNDTTPLAQKLRHQLSGAAWFPSPVHPSDKSAKLGDELAADESNKTIVDSSVETSEPQKISNGVLGDSNAVEEHNTPALDAATAEETVAGSEIASSKPLVEGDVALSMEPGQDDAGGDDRKVEGPSVDEPSDGSAQNDASSLNKPVTSQVVRSSGAAGIDLEAGGQALDGVSVDIGGASRANARALLDDDDKARKYRKTAARRYANEAMRRWLAVKRLARKHRRNLILAAVALVVIVFVCWLLFGGDTTEPIPERASHNLHRFERELEEEVKGLEEGMEQTLARDMQRLKTVQLPNSRFKRPESQQETE
uniref:RING-type domain-containing protein n=1 Tax=Erythrolobus australicus TaxID=1077150 RepID=A0A7S1TLC5_9RHOD